MKAFVALALIVMLISPTQMKEIPLARPGNIQVSLLRDSVNHILGFLVLLSPNGWILFMGRRHWN
jgi:hypothetical protein